MTVSPLPLSSLPPSLSPPSLSPQALSPQALSPQTLSPGALLSQSRPAGIDPASYAGVSGPSIDSVLEDFEGIFVSMMLKEMRKSVGKGFFGGDKADAIGGLFDMTLGEELGRSGGLGIAAALSRYQEVAETTNTNRLANETGAAQ